jgi:O-antigen/teichoic acid export membrane protein
VTFYIILITPDVVHLFLPKWIDAILPIQLIAYFGGIRSLSSGSGSVFLAKGKPNLLLPISLTQVIFLAVFLYPTIHFFGLIGVCILVNIDMTISCVWGFLRLKTLIGLSLKSLLRIMIFPIIVSICIIIFILFVSNEFFTYDKMVLFLLKTITFPIVYLITTRLLSDTPQLILKDLLNIN